ncbi:MAG: hypothetical protein P1U80_10300 [Pseudomonadales bacterium]|jgi:hypothetical protein|nr:hypothetical protein [Pseudomonadales bacterium]
MRYLALGLTEQLALPTGNNDPRSNLPGQSSAIDWRSAISERLRLKFDVRKSNAFRED